MPFCKTCNRHYFTGDRHTCPPTWRAWDIGNEGEPDDGRDVRAHDGEDAAEEYVKTLEEVRDGDDFTIGVRQGSGPIERYRVTASLTWSYSTERVEDEEPETATITPTGEPVDEAQEAARTVRDDDEEPPREAVEPMVGMPRHRALDGRIEVDGRRPGGVIARFVSLGNWHEMRLHADRYDGEPCETMDDLERMVLFDIEDVEGVRPTSLSLRPLEVSDG